MADVVEVSTGQISVTASTTENKVVVQDPPPSLVTLSQPFSSTYYSGAGFRNISDGSNQATAVSVTDVFTLNAQAPASVTVNPGTKTGSITVANATTSADGAMSSADKTKLDAIEASATADQTGAEIKTLYEAEANTNAFTDAQVTKLTGIETSATADQTGAEIKSLYEAEANTNAFTDAQVTKLTGIESSATADQTGAEIKTLYEAEADTNAFTDAESTKLSQIESNATADQTGAEIKALYEAEANTNAFTDADVTKLNGIPANADDNVKADWNSSSGDSEILNKPTIPSGNQVIDWTQDQGATNIHANNYTDTNTTYVNSDFDHDQLTNFVANEHIDWTTDQGATNIHSGNYINTTYTEGDGGLTEKNFTTALKNKLDGIATGAEVNVQSDWSAGSGDAQILNKPTIPSVINDLSNVNTGATITDGYVLKWNNSSSEWQAAADATTGGAGLNADTLDSQDGTYYLNYNNFSNTPTIPSGNQIIDWTTDQGSTDIHPGNYTDTNTTYVSSDFDHDQLTNFAANEHIDWTVDQGTTNIHAGNYTDTNTTYVSSDFDHDQLTNFVANEHLDWTTDQGANNIHVNNLPAIAITTVQTAANQSAQLALTTQEGDVVIRSDENKSYIRNSGTAGTMADFTVLATGSGAVLSVNGSTGAVTLTHDGFSDFVANEHIDWTTDQGATNIHTGNYTNTTYVDSDFDHDQLTNFVANEHIDWTTDQGATNIHSGNYTNTTYVDSDFDHDQLTNFVANEHIDWTASGAGTIDASNYTNTTYSVGDGGLTQKNFTTTLKTKLDGIETGAESNVQVDWHISNVGSDAYIKNKPTIITLSSVDLHLNQSTASSSDVLSWNGTDYAWVAQNSSGIANVQADTSPALGGNLDVNGNDIVSVSNGDVELAPHGTGVVIFKGDATKGSGQFKLNCESNSHAITLKGPPHSASANYTLTLPNTDGNAGEVLKTDGSGNLDWVVQTTAFTNSDVDTHLNQSNPTSGYVLSWNGSDYAWVAQSGGGGSYADSDVDTHLNVSGASSGHILSWNGSDYAWVADQTGGGGGGGGITTGKAIAMAMVFG